MLGLGEEVGEGAGVKLGLEELAAVEELLAGRVEGAVQDGEELEGGGREEVLVAACEGIEGQDGASAAARADKDGEGGEEDEEEKGAGNCGG